MEYPKLKNALLCRILVYVTVLSTFIAPIVVIASMSFVDDLVKVVVMLTLPIALIIYIIKNFAVLMGMDITLAKLHCHNTARKCFTLPESFDIERTKRRISHYGKSCSPSQISPAPQLLQYKCNASMTVYASGIEKVITVYSVDCLDKEEYQLIRRSAVANSNLLKGKRKLLILDKTQRETPLNRVTIILIFAQKVEEKFRQVLHKKVCQDDGDGFDDAILSCVVDMDTGFVTFDSERLPYVGYQYPVKNRGIKLIRKYLFSGRFPYATSPDLLDSLEDIDLNESLWDFWKRMRKELISDEKKTRKLYENMNHEDIIVEDDFLYLKWEGYGVFLSTETVDTTKEVLVDAIEFWYYPKKQKIAKETIKQIQTKIDLYYEGLGYKTRYNSYE